MRLTTIGLFITVLPACAFAGPPALDLVGLVPGVSTPSDYDKTLVKYSGGRKAISVGGFEIRCIPDYIDGLLAELFCPIGKNRGSLVEPVDRIIEASNIDVFEVLINGYTKKFGRPDTSINDPVQTRAGVDHIRRVVTWIDSKGNQMTLMSMTTSLDEGAVVLKSQEKLATDAAAERATEQKRKF